MKTEKPPHTYIQFYWDHAFRLCGIVCGSVWLLQTDFVCIKFSPLCKQIIYVYLSVCFALLFFTTEMSCHHSLIICIICNSYMNCVQCALLHTNWIIIFVAQCVLFDVNRGNDHSNEIGSSSVCRFQSNLKNQLSEKEAQYWTSLALI